MIIIWHHPVYSWTHAESSTYILTAYRSGGYQLLRRADNATLFFQGDDESLWDNVDSETLDMHASEYDGTVLWDSAKGNKDV